jgi:Protein of unknown function (DUF1761)
MVPINYWAVLLSAVAAMVIGWLWYGPLFGKQWASAMGFSPEYMQEAMKKSGAKSYIIMAIGAILMAFILDHAIIFASAYLGLTGIAGGVVFAFLNWLGFIAPVTIGSVLWENKPLKFWFITSGYYLVTLLVMGIILSLWM